MKSPFQGSMKPIHFLLAALLCFSTVSPSHAVLSRGWDGLEECELGLSQRNPYTTPKSAEEWIQAVAQALPSNPNWNRLEGTQKSVLEALPYFASLRPTPEQVARLSEIFGIFNYFQNPATRRSYSDAISSRLSGIQAFAKLIQIAFPEKAPVALSQERTEPMLSALQDSLVVMLLQGNLMDGDLTAAMDFIPHFNARFRVVYLQLAPATPDRSNPILTPGHEVMAGYTMPLHYTGQYAAKTDAVFQARVIPRTPMERSIRLALLGVRERFFPPTQALPGGQPYQFERAQAIARRYR